MQVYKCILSGDEMFSCVYDIEEIYGGMMYKVTGKLVVSKSEDIDGSLIGANASAEGGDEEMMHSTSASVINIVHNHNLVETHIFTKESYTIYLKKYLNDVKKKLMERNPDRVKDFMAGAGDCLKKIRSNWDNWMIFTGESMDPDGAVGLVDYEKDNITPYFLFFKDGLEMIKY